MLGQFSLYGSWYVINLLLWTPALAYHIIMPKMMNAKGNPKGLEINTVPCNNNFKIDNDYYKLNVQDLTDLGTKRYDF